MKTQASAETHMVYVIGSPSSHRVKIGHSKEMSRRLPEIQRMSPVILEVLWRTSGDHRLEAALHQEFKAKRVHGEWFDFEDEDPLPLIEEAVTAYRSRPSPNRGGFAGFVEEGAAEFATGTFHLGVAIRNSMRVGMSPDEMDQIGILTWIEFDGLWLRFREIARLASHLGDPHRAEMWDAAAGAALGMRDALGNTVPKDYWGHDQVGED